MPGQLKDRGVVVRDEVGVSGQHDPVQLEGRPVGSSRAGSSCCSSSVASEGPGPAARTRPARLRPVPSGRAGGHLRCRGSEEAAAGKVRRSGSRSAPRTPPAAGPGPPGRPGGFFGKDPPASATVARWSSCLEPKCAYRPVLLIPVATCRERGDARLVGEACAWAGARHDQTHLSAGCPVLGRYRAARRRGCHCVLRRDLRLDVRGRHAAGSAGPLRDRQARREGRRRDRRSPAGCRRVEHLRLR